LFSFEFELGFGIPSSRNGPLGHERLTGEVIILASAFREGNF